MGAPILVAGIPVINNLADAANYAVNIDTYEVITQSLYDSQDYPHAGVGTLSFFQQPVGGGTSQISGNPKSPEDTNMTAAGMVQNLQAFVVTSVEVDFQPGVGASTATLFPAAELPAFQGAAAVVAVINDVWKFRTTGWLNFTIGSKPYLIEGPMMKFPASNDFEIDAALCNATTPAASLFSQVAYGKAVGPAYMLAPNNLLLIPMQSFNVTLNWATVESLPSGVDARVFVRLMGQLLRAAQ